VADFNTKPEGCIWNAVTQIQSSKKFLVRFGVLAICWQSTNPDIKLRHYRRARHVEYFFTFVSVTLKKIK
jgi:hypothetical protein